MSFYREHLPITMYCGVIDADYITVARALTGMASFTGDVEWGDGGISAGMAALAPLGPGDRLLVMETVSGGSCFFCNGFMDGMVRSPLLTLGRQLECRCVFFMRIPNTISRDRRSGLYGGRAIEMHQPGAGPFEVCVVNDAGRWSYDHSPTVLPFEEADGPPPRRPSDRLPDEQLERYAEALGCPVWDPSFYGDRFAVAAREGFRQAQRLTPAQAREKLRLDS